jgi:hypothetical protein
MHIVAGFAGVNYVIPLHVSHVVSGTMLTRFVLIMSSHLGCIFTV